MWCCQGFISGPLLFILYIRPTRPTDRLIDYLIELEMVPGHAHTPSSTPAQDPTTSSRSPDAMKLSMSKRTHSYMAGVKRRLIGKYFDNPSEFESMTVST